MQRHSGPVDEMTICGVTYRIAIVPAKGRNASARFNGTDVRIAIPSHMSAAEAEKIYADLKARAIKYIERHGVRNDAPIHFHDGQNISLLGTDFRVSVVESAAKISRSRLLDDGKIEIRLAAGLDKASMAKHADSLARRTISAALRAKVWDMANKINARCFNFEIKSIRIGKPSSTRWGSCSPKSGRINLSFRLLFAPRIVIDSVIVHELAHLKVADHSDAFWRLVYGAMPNYKEVRKWLNKNGHSLGPGFMADGSELQRLSGACAPEPIVGARAGGA